MKIMITRILLLASVSTANAGLFSPDNYDDCVLDKIGDAQTLQAIKVVKTACRNKFPYKTVITPEKNKLYKDGSVLAQADEFLRSLDEPVKSREFLLGEASSALYGKAYLYDQLDALMCASRGEGKPNKEGEARDYLVSKFRYLGITHDVLNEMRSKMQPIIANASSVIKSRSTYEQRDSKCDVTRKDMMKMYLTTKDYMDCLILGGTCSNERSIMNMADVRTKLGVKLK